MRKAIQEALISASQTWRTSTGVARDTAMAYIDKILDTVNEPGDSWHDAYKREFLLEDED